MIQLPQRSVTRFFIPLIDVLTLLFCIFLVMPLAQNSDQALAEQLTAKEAELERLRKPGQPTRGHFKTSWKSLRQADATGR